MLPITHIHNHHTHTGHHPAFWFINKKTVNDVSCPPIKGERGGGKRRWMGDVDVLIDPLEKVGAVEESELMVDDVDAVVVKERDMTSTERDDFVCRYVSYVSFV
jgi:hypothetical protein